MQVELLDVLILDLAREKDPDVNIYKSDNASTGIIEIKSKPDQ